MTVAAQRLGAHLVRLEEDEVLVGLGPGSPLGDGHENHHQLEVGVDSHLLSCCSMEG